jgi:hypothetical protein
MTNISEYQHLIDMVDGRKKKTSETETVPVADSGSDKSMNPYNRFVKQVIADIQKTDPSMPMKQRFSIAAERWRALDAITKEKMI